MRKDYTQSEGQVLKKDLLSKINFGKSQIGMRHYSTPKHLW